MKRAWINQPSRAQKFHYLHGKRAIMDYKKEDGEIATIYFCEGSLVSMMIPRNALVVEE